MNGKKSIAFAWLLVLSLSITMTGCKKEEKAPEKEEVKSVTPVDCLALDHEACQDKATDCRYLHYYTKSGGLCVKSAAPEETECVEVEEAKLCELEGYLAPGKKCETAVDGKCANFTVVVKKTPKQLFALSNGWTAGKTIDTELTDFAKLYKLLTTDEEKKELADEKGANGENLFNRLTQAKISPSNVNFTRQYLDTLGAAKAAEQVRNKVLGRSPLFNLTDPSRSGDDLDERKKDINLIVEKGADDVNALPADHIKLLLESINAAADQAKMQDYFKKIGASPEHKKAWLAYAVEVGSPTAKAAVKAVINDPANAGFKGLLVGQLMASAVEADYAAAPGQPKVKFIEMINNPTEWVDAMAFDNPNIKLVDDPGITPGTIPVALMRFLSFKKANALLTPADLTYVYDVMKAFKVKLTPVVFDNLMTSTNALNDISAKIAGTPEQKTFFSKLMLQKNAEAFQDVWNRIKALPAGAAWTVPEATTVTNNVDMVLSVADRGLKLDLLTALLSIAPDASSGGLQLIHRFLRYPLIAATSALYAKIDSALPAAPAPGLNKATWLQQQSVAPAANAGRFAIADFFAGIAARALDAAGTFAEVTKLMSSANPDVIVANSVMPVVFGRIAVWFGAISVANRGNILAQLKVITDLANAAPGNPAAEALRKAIVKPLVQQRVAANQVGLINIFADSDMRPIDQPFSAIYDRIWGDLDAADRLAAVKQVRTDDNTTALASLLKGPALVGAEVADQPRFNNLLAQIITANTEAFVPDADVNAVWARLNSADFANPGQKNRILAIWDRILGIRGIALPAEAYKNSIRQKFVFGIIGGPANPPKAYAGGSPVGYVGQTFMQRVIAGITAPGGDAALNALYGGLLNDQLSSGPVAPILTQLVNTVWDVIKGVDFNNVANHPMITSALDLLFNLGAPVTGAEKNQAILELATRASSAASGHLFLSNKILRVTPLTNAVKDWFVKIFDALPLPTSGAAFTQRNWLEQQAGAGAASGANRFALADFFVSRDATDIGNVKANFDEITKRMSAANPNVTAPNSVVPSVWTVISGLVDAGAAGGILLANRANFLKQVRSFTRLADGVVGVGAQALRENIVRNVVNLNGPVDNQRLVHLLAGMPDIDQSTFNAFDIIRGDVDAPNRKAWAEQTTTSGKTALGYILARGHNTGPQVESVRNSLLNLAPIVGPADAAHVWARLENFHFNVNAERDNAMAILFRIASIPNTTAGHTAIRKQFTLGLVGGDPGTGAIAAKVYGAGKAYPPGAVLIQTMVLGRIDLQLVNVMEQILNDQQALGKKPMLDAAGGGLPVAIKALTDWNGAALSTPIVLAVDFPAAARVTVGGTLATLLAGDVPAQWARLVRMFLNNDAALAAIDLLNYDANRSYSFLQLLFQNSLPIGSPQRFAEFLPFFKNSTVENREELAWVSVQADGRGPAIAKIMGDATVPPADKLVLRDYLFTYAIEQDFTTKLTAAGAVDPVTASPIAAMAGGLIYDALPAFDRLLDGTNPYGLPATFLADVNYSFTFAPGNKQTGNLMWLLMAKLRQFRAGKVVTLIRLQGLVSTVAYYIMDLFPGMIAGGAAPAGWAAAVGTASAGGTPPNDTATLIVEDATLATDNATAKAWLGLP